MPFEKYLLIKKSTLPGAGLGLFAKKRFRKGDRIVEYKGRRLPWREAKKEDGHNGYLLRLNRTTAIDAQPYKKAMGRYANDAAGLSRIAGKRNNAEYLTYGDQCFIEATRTIRKGDEIFVSYGRDFWTLQRKLRRQKLKGTL
ncbi:MAG: SET domain-containing protein-lysine N-methyltransferase [Cyclobacteriaceae bacterium]|nr:SET domain-containing protein-lysine N-methyltransferase [Cyclobacteriaceae bacterium]